MAICDDSNESSDEDEEKANIALTESVHCNSDSESLVE